MEGRRKDSKFGIISVALFATQFLAALLLISIDLSKYASASTGSTLLLNPATNYILVTLFIIVNLIGTLLGILGLFEKSRKKGFAVSGLLLNGFITVFLLNTLLPGMIR